MMMNYLLSQGQWKAVTNKFPALEYKIITKTVGQSDGGGSKTETTEDISKPPKNQADINAWFDINDKALGNIMLRLHPTIATTVLNLLQKTMKENDDINTMFASQAWEFLETTYGNPGIAATYKELKAMMDVDIPGNANPTLAINVLVPLHHSNNNSSNLNKRSSTKGTRTPNEEVGEEDVEDVEELLGERALVKTNKTSNNRPQGLLRNAPHLPLPPLFLARSPLLSSSLTFPIRSTRTSPTPSPWHTVLVLSPPSKRLKGLESLRGLKRNSSH